jgi:hypothetical protein
LPKSEYDDKIVYQLKMRMWKEAYKFAKELKERESGKRTVSAMEFIAAFHSMIEETNHNWIEEKREWDDILASEP